jgi:hypothetical protein
MLDIWDGRARREGLPPSLAVLLSIFSPALVPSNNRS